MSELYENSTQNPRKNISILIDSDNASPHNIKSIINEISKLGDIIINRAYGNWSKPNLSSWIPKLNENNIEPIMQLDCNSLGKNSSDMAIVIDAMDNLYTKNIDILVLVTSDSDFKSIAIRYRTSGKKVIGIGENKTPISFQLACNTFLFTENINQEYYCNEREILRNKNKIDKDLIVKLTTAIINSQNEDGWANIARVGNFLSSKYSLSSTNYGYAKLIDLIKSIERFEVMYETNTLVLVKVKRAYKFKL
jgi:uncharacterized protein (TIGR00288 family)